jgi:hypothetical protein
MTFAVILSCSNTLYLQQMHTKATEACRVVNKPFAECLATLLISLKAFHTVQWYTDNGQLLLHISLTVKSQTRFDFQEAIISGTASVQFNSLLVQKLKSYYDIIINIMVDHKIYSDHIGIFRSHIPISSLGVRRLCVLWVYTQLLCGLRHTKMLKWKIENRIIED